MLAWRGAFCVLTLLLNDHWLSMSNGKFDYSERNDKVWTEKGKKASVEMYLEKKPRNFFSRSLIQRKPSNNMYGML